MKKEITLYCDTDDILTETEFQMMYEDLKFDHETAGETFPATYEEFKNSRICSGTTKVITAYLSDRKHVYPYYFMTDENDVMTIKEFYGIWQECREWRNQDTFADLLDNPQIDRNGVDFYGFYL